MLLQYEKYQNSSILSSFIHINHWRVLYSKKKGGGCWDLAWVREPKDQTLFKTLEGT